MLAKREDLCVKNVIIKFEHHSKWRLIMKAVILALGKFLTEKVLPKVLCMDIITDNLLDIKNIRQFFMLKNSYAAYGSHVA